jgi:hypothetical protein
MKLILTNTTPPIEYPLLKQTTILGSASDVDINLGKFGVFPHHAVITQNKGMFTLSDWNKKGEVYVNGKLAMQGQPLWIGDEIRLGEAHLIFHRNDVSMADLEPQPSTPKPAPQESQAQAENQQTRMALQQLATLDQATLERLRQQSPNIRPVSGLSAFLQQGLTQASGQQGKGLFGLVFALPATFLSTYQAVRTKLLGQTTDEAFPEGTWQFYTQFGLREDPARHANETQGFHQAISPLASEVDQAAAWVFQCMTTIFEYESLLENEWVERTLLRLVNEAIADSVANKLTTAKVGINVHLSSEDFQATKKEVQKEEIERIEIETEQVKQNLGLSNLEWAWVKERPYRKPPDHPHETYPQYRRKRFLEFLVKAANKLPTQMGAFIWDRYHELSSTALPAYQAQMSLLYTLKPGSYQEKKVPIPLWKAKLAFVVGGRYYLISLAHRDPRGRLLVFRPGKPDDPGEPLTLNQTDKGALVDQKGRSITVDRKGNVTIVDSSEYSQIKVLRPTPASLIKAQVAAILHEAKVLPPSDSCIDILLAVAPRAQTAHLCERLPKITQVEMEAFDDIPLIINWDEKNRAETLYKIRSGHRGVGNHALTIFRTQSSFVFDQSHIFYDAIWGMVISQVITDGAIEAYQLMAKLPPSVSHIGPLSPLRLQDNSTFQNAVKRYTDPIEVTAETETPDLDLLNTARKHLARINIPATVNDILTIYRGIYDQMYVPSLDVQRALANFRLAGHGSIADQVEAIWQERTKEPISLFLPMDASFIDPKLRLFPATFKNFLPDFADVYEKTGALLSEQTYTPSPEGIRAFQEKRGVLMAYMLAMTEYFKMLKRITRQGESISTAAIKYLAHLPPGMQGTLDLIPEQIGALNEILKGEEVFSNVGRVSPTSSLIRFMSAKDDGNSKMTVWGIMCDSRGNLKITLRDFRPHVAKMLALGYESLAKMIARDTLEAYALGLNQFAEDITRILTAKF